MSALPGTPSIQNAIPMPFFGTTPFAAPGLGMIASLIMLSIGLWWLLRAEKAARQANEGYGEELSIATSAAADDERLRGRATTAREFDPAEISHGHRSEADVPVVNAVLPLVVVVVVNLVMSLVVLPRLDVSFLAEQRWGSTSLPAVAGVWSVVVALAGATATVVICNWTRLPALRQTMDAGANASVLPALTVASLVGFGAVIAALPAFDMVRDWALDIKGGPLVSLAVSTNLLAALTGSASGGLTIALDALGQTYMDVATREGIDPGLLHRVAVIGSGTLDILPHNGAVVSLLAICGLTHRQSYLDIVMVGIVSSVVALAAVIAMGSALGSF
jgi:H+/gluconate symporter-like permease